MRLPRSTAFAIAAVCICLSRPANSADVVEPASVRKIFDDGRHNAFTAMVRWQGRLWLAFRNAPSHGYGEADIVILTSDDGRDWTEHRRINVLPDDRDPQFVATDKRLFLYMPSLEGTKTTSFVLYTDDGSSWSKPQPIYQRQFILWKPLVHKGRFYATAHKKAEGQDGGKVREVHLITSPDGVLWEKVSTIRAGNWESETTLHFEPDGRLVGFLRQKYSTPGFILESQPPYKEWSQRPAGTHFSGHCIYDIAGVTYLLSRTMEGNNTGTMIYTWDGESLTPYCKLPSGGDCSYAAVVTRERDMLVSYYSSHEGKTSVYLAEVPLQKSALGTNQVANVANEEELFVAKPITQPKEFTPGIEGPATDAAGNIYAVNFAKQGTIGKVTPQGQGDVFVTLPDGSVGNGIRFDKAGWMYVADYAQHNILRVNMQTREVSVFAHEGAMNQPNDLAIGPDGTLYASDPNWGKSTGQIWRISSKGEVRKVASEMGTTNGIELSPDGKTLYVNESVQRNVWVFDVAKDGSLSGKKLLRQFPDHGFDGMRCDIDGNLYITRYGKGTVAVVSPQGEVLREIDVLGKSPSNLCFGGPDGRTVYVTEVEHTRLVQFRVDQPGLEWQRWQEARRK